MKKILVLTLLIISMTCSAELPSWGMTENQYKLPNFNTKMSEIGAQAVKNNWLLKITAPKDWHNNIRAGLTDSGARDVQVNFKDSLYQSIAISAAKGIKIANVSESSDTEIVQKQVVIDKPDIDTEVEVPEFGDLEISSNGNELLENINNIEITVPKVSNGSSANKPKSNPQVNAANNVTVKSVPEPVELSGDALKEEIKEKLRKRYARTKRVDKLISYNNIKSKDDLFIQNDVVLVKRFINQGVVLYFWMKESYDPSIHKLIEKGSGKYQKDPSAPVGASPETVSIAKSEPEEQTQLSFTDLEIVAIDTNVEDQDDLRSDFARNKRVELSINASQLKKDDELYVKNNTVLVKRPITSSQFSFFWLVGDTNIPHEVERKSDERFIVR